MANIHKEREEDIWLGGKSPRLTPTQKRKIKEYCLKRDGKRCMICNREEPNIDNLEIDHKNGNPADHRAENLRLAHHRCNAREYHKRMSSQCQRDATRQASSFNSPEVILNREYEPAFRKYCFKKVLECVKNGTTIKRDDLRKEARDYVGCSLQTSYSYMERLFLDNGPLEEVEDYYTGEKYVKFKDPKDANLSVEQLMLKYPKEGRRYSKNVDLE
ncbi:MAG: hypothetical protein KatS3mg003_0842 [Candidatus Nitrosocaldaceae archaeon]|nr:MAG: hypothetical protein KatS3mg003_0842 [Candidatus Nitrosocaldaceae archaeon]